MNILAQATENGVATWLQALGYIIGGVVLVAGGGKGGFMLQKRRANGAASGTSPAWCDKRHEDLEKQRKHDRQELEKRLDERHLNQSASLSRIETGIKEVHTRIDLLYSRGGD